ncbi:LexA family transcriptional regulator [Acetobacter cerevisiae]|uniref:LexA family transcriptional regulator n=1 Tax=Acetobacter cerevisiae TaxID=178900 RepID=UPI0020A210BB|nr:LexA family transcriptional regulator [Acetobacter cerevisiae]MCP1271235.1 LexA family transcriptional regulator [Acetobacter cerevisiae]MCP1279189.1 LexA family transcriptional regulator [Acetobacter cerevisiae]
MNYEEMDDWPARLKKFRASTRLSQAKVGRALGIAAASVAQWEIGRSKPMLDRLPAIAALYNVSLEELCGRDLGSPQEALKAAGNLDKTVTKLPVAGFVAGADRVVIFQDGDIDQDGDVELPFAGYNGIILRVQGESMVPRYKPGEVVGIHFPGKESLSLKMIGKDVVAKLSDGQMVLKTVAPGPSPSSFVLASVNPMVPPIYNPEIEWVSQIDFHVV